MVLSSFPSKFCFLLGIRFVFIRLGYGLWVKKPPQVSSLQDTWRSLCSGISFDFQEIWLHSNASPSQGMLNQVTLWGFDASFNPSFEPNSLGPREHSTTATGHSQISQAHAPKQESIKRKFLKEESSEGQRFPCQSPFPWPPMAAEPSNSTFEPFLAALIPELPTDKALPTLLRLSQK